MNAKKVAGFTAMLLALVLLLDFMMRLAVKTGEQSADKAAVQQSQIAQVKPAGVLTLEEVNTLLAWSDVKPSPQQLAQAEAEAKAAAAAAAANTPPPPPQVDVHQQVSAAISGDVSKSLIGDKLFTLRGVFYDKTNFAVLEVENIVTKEKQYFRASVKQTVDNHQLMEVGKNHVILKNGDQNIRLQMFEGTL